MIAGVDGCRAGWIIALSDSWPCRSAVHLYICRDFDGVRVLASSCEAVAIDIPIGLPSGKTPRVCDIEAREELGEAGRDRVFFTPPREALDAQKPEVFQERVRRLVGKGAGFPVWGIVPKILEVDRAITAQEQERICEFHPELVWRKLGGRVLARKKTEEGLRARIELLERSADSRLGMGPILGWKIRLGQAARPDDLLDAIVGLAAADDFRRRDTSCRIPRGDVPRDDRGLRMEMWF